MKNIIYIIAAIGAIVLLAIGQELRIVSTAILLIIGIYTKYSETKRKRKNRP